jgi:hypothetical protein
LHFFVVHRNFDISDRGRRFEGDGETHIPGSKIKIKTVSDSPEIRNLSDEDEVSDPEEGNNGSSSSKVGRSKKQQTTPLPKSAKNSSNASISTSSACMFDSFRLLSFPQQNSISP